MVSQGWMTSLVKGKAPANQKKYAWAPGVQLLLSGMLILSLTACASLPASIEAPVNLPEAFSASGDRLLPRRWWLELNEPVLTRLIDQALSENLNLHIAWDRLAQSQAIARQAGAPLLPAVDGLAEASTALSRQTIDGAINTNRSEDFLLGIAASYEVDLWSRVRATHEAAVLDVEASEQELLAAAITISSQVALTWYQLSEQYGQLALLDDQIETNRQVLELVSLRFRQGQVGAADVLRQRQLVESTRGERVQVVARAEVLAHQLAILLGRPPRSIALDQGTELVALPPLPDTGLPAELIRRRPDIRQAYFEVLSADQRIAAAIADKYPQINLVASTTTVAENVSDLFTNWIASIAANLIAPLFDAGLRAAEVDRTQAVTSQRLHEYGQTILTALAEVEDALVQEREQRLFIDSLETQLTLAG